MGKSAPGYIAADDLRLGFERIETLEAEKKAIADDIKDVFAEFKSKGFDVPTMKTVLKLRKMEPDDRRHSLSMVELYMAAIGMGEDSLSDMARGFLADRAKGYDEPEPAVDQTVPEFDRPTVPNSDGDQGPPREVPAPLTVDDAKRLGADAQKSGRPITANPFPSRDPRRAAWDEAWCSAGGSDGMDIPEFLMSDAAIEAKRKKDAERERADAEAAAAVLVNADKSLDAAREFVIREQSGSTAALQKTLGIGYNAAARCMELLEAEGVVSAPDLKGKREVLVAKPDEDE